MIWCYSRKLCLVSIWISALHAFGHCQQFGSTTETQELSSSTILTIIFSVLGPILGIAIIVACSVCCYCCSKQHREQGLCRGLYHDSICEIQPPNTTQPTNIHQQRTLSYSSAFPQGINSTTGWQQTMAHSNNWENRQTVQGTR